MPSIQCPSNRVEPGDSQQRQRDKEAHDLTDSYPCQATDDSHGSKPRQEELRSHNTLPAIRDQSRAPKAQGSHSSHCYRRTNMNFETKDVCSEDPSPSVERTTRNSAPHRCGYLRSFGCMRTFPFRTRSIRKAEGALASEISYLTRHRGWRGLLKSKADG
jgi:hypothetical protein